MKKFAGKPSRLEANPRKPQKFSTANDLHYTVFMSFNTIESGYEAHMVIKHIHFIKCIVYC